MEKELGRVVELDIPDFDQKDFQIAWVDAPAIESDFLYFSETKQRFKVDSEEKRIVSGYAMISDLTIYRRDKNGKEYHVVFRKEDIKKIALNFIRKVLTKNTNKNHETGNIIVVVYVFESILIDSERGTKAPDRFEQEADGSWFISMKVENDEIWKQVLDGTFKGFSVEGLFEESFISQVEALFKSYKVEK